MRILIVSQYFWPEPFRISDLAAGLVERGHEVTVLTGIPNYPEGKFYSGYGIFRKWKEDYRGALVLRVPLVPRGRGGGVRLALNYFSFAVSASVLGPFLCRMKIDLIFVCQLSPVTVAIPAIVLKSLKKAPILMWILDLWPESLVATGALASGRLLASVDRLVRFIYSRCERIVLGSQGFVESVVARGVGKERVGYFPNWHEPEYATDQSSQGKPQRPDLPKGFRVMFAGNIGAAQDFESVLAAAEKLRTIEDIQWIVLGDGRRFVWLKEQVQQRGLTDRIHLLGWHAQSEMPKFFAQADVMLVTLKRDPTFALTVPGKIQSYMACGRPIIAAVDGEGGRLIIGSGSGLAPPAEDSDALANAILAMHSMPREEREVMGLMGKKYCEENFDREMLMDRLECLMQGMISENNYVGAEH